MAHTRITTHGAAVLAAILAPAAVQAQAGRSEIALATGWKFQLGGPAGEAAATPAFDDRGWDSVAVPHTWNKLGNYQTTRRADANAVRGIGWYRLHFAAPRRVPGARVFLQFDAASIVADVWLNGKRLGRHEGAFSRFRFDATDALQDGGDNVLAVRVDNSKPDPGSATRHIVPISGDFFMYGGLYRPVSMIVVGAQHVDLLDMGSAGVYERTLALDDRTASVSIRTRLRNEAKRVAALTVRTRVADATGKQVAIDERRVQVPAGSVSESLATLAIARPRRWNGRADPYLYRTTVQVLDSAGRMLDRVEQPLGLRTMKIDAARGFILNGKPTPLHGVTRHQDRQDKGWALSDADHAEDMALIEEMGSNSVRLSHYNHAQPFYDLADRDGMVLWAELGLVNLAALPGERDASPEMVASARQQLSELIRQNYNHPSVATWSIGNEITNWTSKGLTPSNARPLMTNLDRLAHVEDPDRPTTIAVCCEPLPGERETGVDRTSGTADTVAYNLYLGWYGSGHAEEAGKLGAVMSALHRERPQLPIGVGEYGAGGATSQHTDNPYGGRIESIYRPQAEEVQSAVHELSWKGLAPLDFLWGSYVWQMFDATSDLREEGDSFDINTKGLVTFDRKVRKDSFWFYKAAWSSDPVLYLTGRRYVDRAYQVTDVRAYSNAAQAMLSVNGRPIGGATCVDHVCTWPGVRLAAGDNRVTVSARVGGKSVTDEVRWRYAGPADAMHMRTGSLTGVTLADGTRYGSDTFFTGGTGFTLNPYQKELYASGAGATPKARKTVTGAAVPELYASWRAGAAFSYTLPVPDGRYRVTLHLMEPTEAPGKRVFSVVASGGARRDGIDVAALAGGPLRATRIELPAVAERGMLKLDFRGITGEAIVSAIDVMPAR